MNPSNRTAQGPRLGKLTKMATPTPVTALAGSHDAYDAAGGCRVIVGLEPARSAPPGVWLPPAALMLWHLSISHPRRYPTWDEVADARYELIPEDVTMAMLLPPPGEYVNHHPTVLHLWQIDDRRAP